MYEDLRKQLREEADCLDNYAEVSCFMREAADAIEQLSNAGSAYGRGWTLGYDAGREESKPRWIPVTERLPGREWVLCKCRAKIHEVLRLRDGYWYHDPQHQYMSGFVTHWMPLPEPPKEKI